MKSLRIKESEGIYVRLSYAETFLICMKKDGNFLYKVMNNNIAIQGEFCGPGIQKNRLGLLWPEWFVFTVIDLDTNRRYPLDKMQVLCETLLLDTVPIEEIESDFIYNSVEELLERANGKYDSGKNKEGIVIRPVEPVYSPTIRGPLSMKVLNNEYLLKE